MIVNRRSTDTHDGINQSRSEQESDLRQFVSFSIGEQDYGLDILFVREIKAWTGTTRLPNSPEYMRGVINLRGAIVPVIDLATRFGAKPIEATPSTVIIIVSIGGAQTGLLVDSVSDILTVNKNEIASIPELDADRRNPFFSGLISVQGKLLAIVALENILRNDSTEGAVDATVLAAAPRAETFQMQI
jgi:purine-binding chemotaxis protein CheW